MSHNLRKLGHIETVMSIMHNYFKGTTQGMPIAVLDSRICETHLRKAAILLSRKYAILRAIIREKEGEYYFCSSGNTSYIEVLTLETKDKADTSDKISEILHSNIDQRYQLCKIYALYQSDIEHTHILFPCHHAIIDTQGFYAVLSDLFFYIDQLQQNRSVTVKDVGLPPPIDKKLMEGVIEASDQCNRSQQVPHQMFSPLSERVTKYLRLSITSNSHQLLDKICKTRGVRLNSFLGALLCQCSHSCGLTTSPTIFKSAVSLRERISIEEDYRNQLGCYISVADSCLDIESYSIIDIAKAYEKCLMFSIYKNCFIMKNIASSAIKESLLPLENMTSFSGIGMSNLGKVDIPNIYTNFNIVDYIPLTNRIGGNHAIVLHVHEFRSNLELLFIYVTPLVSESLAKRLVDSYMGYLDTVTTQQCLVI